MAWFKFAIGCIVNVGIMHKHNFIIDYYNDYDCHRRYYNYCYHYGSCHNACRSDSN